MRSPKAPTFLVRSFRFCHRFVAGIQIFSVTTILCDQRKCPCLTTRRMWSVHTGTQSENPIPWKTSCLKSTKRYRKDRSQPLVIEIFTSSSHRNRCQHDLSHSCQAGESGCCVDLWFRFFARYLAVFRVVFYSNSLYSQLFVCAV